MKKSPLKFYSPNYFVPTFFGIGDISKAPGTLASFAAILPGYIMQHYFSTSFLLAAAFYVFVFGFITTIYYLRNSESNDPSEVVVDEVVGQWIAMAIFPNTIMGIFVAFVLFRFFDIIKPWPVSFFDKRVKGAFGIMLDDIAAGLYPVFVIYVIFIALQLLHINFNVFEYVTTL